MTLPVCLGLLSAALMVWDIHNQRVIQSMGMGWDTGAPIWPYQTPAILFLALNTPAYIVANPASRLLGLLIPYNYVMLFPCVILWWWLVGTLLDRGLLRPASRTRWFWIVLSSTLAVIFGAAGAYLAKDTLRWELTYGNGFLSWDDLIVLKFAAPAIWCFLIGAALLLLAGRFAMLRLRDRECNR